MDYANPGDALASGLRSGLQLGIQARQAYAERKQHEWEQQLKIAELGMKLVENKNLPAAQRINSFNTGVRPVLARMGIQMPPMTADTITSDAFQSAVKNSNALVDQMRNGKIDPHVGFDAITQHFTGALQQMDAESETQKATRELTVGDAKRYVDEADKNQAHAADKTPTAAEAIDKQNELQMKLANLEKGGDFSQQIAYQALKQQFPNLEEGKVPQEMVDQVKQGVRKSLSFYNQYIPDEYRHKEPISSAEAKALRDKGFSTDRILRDFFLTDAPPGIGGKPPVPPPAAAAAPPAPPAPPAASAAPIPVSAAPMPPLPVAAASAPIAPVAPPPNLSLAGGAVAPSADIPTPPVQLSASARPYDAEEMSLA